MPQKVALVTGSGKRRVGGVVAEHLADRGYAVVIHYHRSEQEASRSVEDLRSRGVDAIAVRADLSREEELELLAREALAWFGRVDVLVNTASVWDAKPLEQVTAADVRHHFEVNTLSTFLLSQQIGLAMVKQPEGGAIINFGDWAIERPYIGYAAYFSSKGAVPALTRSLAVELGSRNPRVRVNCILPGPVLLADDATEARRREVIASTLVQREGQPEHVAQAVLFLIENDFVTGSSVTVDGGRTIYASGH